MSRQRDWPDTLVLQDKLNTHLLQGRRSAILLNKHIRRLKSVRAYILNEKAKVKTELTDYVNKLLENLLDFKYYLTINVDPNQTASRRSSLNQVDNKRSEMLQQLEDVVKAKFNELSMIKTGLEEDIDTLTTLCQETEKLLQFDSEITTYADVHRAETLQKAFGMVHVKSEGEQLELGDILTLKFEPTVDVDRLNCKAFGTLKPPVNSNGSEELSQAVSDNVLANLNYSNNANSGEDSTKNHMPSSGVDINSNSANVQTDINSNLITNTTPASVENKTTCISGIDPAELAAYINELSLAQANNTLAYWLSQLQIQNIPLPDGDPQQVNQIQVQDIPLPEGSSQPVQQPVVVPMSLSQSMSIPLENLGNNVCNSVLPKTVSNDATESVLKPDCVISSVPVLSSDKIVTDIKPEIKVESTVKEKTPPPPGFQAKVTEQSKSSKNEDVFGQQNQGQDHLENIKKENKDETVSMDNKDMESKDQKSKSYIREAKLNVSCLSPKLVESSLTPKLNVTSHSQFERETIESEGALDKEKITTGIEVHEYIGSAVSKKAERSLNDVDDSSDEDEWTEGPDECKEEPEQESLKVSEVCENKAENDSKLKQSAACSRSETLASVESSESKQTENNVFPCEEESAKCASVTNSENNSVKSDVNEVIESIELNREETRQIEAPKPLRRPLSLPRIPYKGRNLNFEAREDSAKVSQGTVKETIETTELRSADKCDVNDKNKLSTDQRDEKKNVDTDLKVEEKVDMAATLPDSAPDLLAKVTETEDPLADNDTTSVFDKIISPEKQLDPKYGEHDDTETNNSESLGKQTSSPDIKRKSQASDNRTSSERNIDTLISQAQWCKSYIQKTLSPKMKKKYESNTDVSSDKAIPQDTCKSEKQSDNTNINKPANTDSDKRKSESSESMNLSRSSESDFKAGSRRRVLSASYTSESWDSELEETVDKTGSPTPGRKSEASKPTMSEKSKEAMKTQASWCRNLIKQTLSPSTKKKNGSVVNSGNLDDRKMNMSESNSDKNKPDLGMTVRIPIKDVKQIVVPVSASGESWDIDGTSDTGTASASQDGKTLVVKPVQRSVRVKESKPDFSLSRSHSDRDRSVLETYRGGNRKTEVKGTKIRTIGSMGKGSSGLYFPIGVTTNSFGDIIITDTGNHLVKMFDSQGVFVKTIGKQCYPPLRRPSAIVVNSEDEIFVKDDICIRKFDRTGANLCDIGKKFFHKPYGLALTEDGILIVLETHYQNPSLVHLTQGGGFIQGYPYQPLFGAQVNSKCRFMAVSGGTVIVSDLGLSQVYLTDLQGCFLQVVGRYGRGPMEFIEPSGVAADSCGNFLVGDSKNNKIKIWQCDGTFLGTVDLSDTFVVRPSGIHLTADNRLLVTNYLHHQVKVYQLEL